MSYTTRVYLQRNAHLPVEDNHDAAFFQQPAKQAAQKREYTSFFQEKLSVGKPDDAYEKEADAVAATVTDRSKNSKPLVQQKAISSIQRLATSAEDEKQGTNDQRMARDKEIQEKPEVQAKCTDCEKEDKDKTVQQKGETNSSASPRLSSGIKDSCGKGDPLPKNTLREMSRSFGVDFGQVKIHNDDQAGEMNRRLKAQAFTYGNDIFFNTGKFDTETLAGKQLLAHELTHVIQQGYSGVADGVIHKQEEEEVFTPAGNLMDEPDLLVADPSSPVTHDPVQNDQLSSWNAEMLSITLISPNATCQGSASPKRTSLMSQCNASHFCTTPATFTFQLFFHFDADVIPRPPGFADADVSVSLDFIPDGQLIPTFSKRETGKGSYAGPGVPLRTPFGNKFSFSSTTDGNLFVAAVMKDPSTGQVITYMDMIRCSIIPCI